VTSLIGDGEKSYIKIMPSASNFIESRWSAAKT